jgi:hypothetical protein
MTVQTEVLASWSAGAARKSIVEFVERIVAEGVPVEERVAVFDNDGTLWCEKPLPIQADFILRRLFEMAQTDPELRGCQPWKAAYERDYGWLGTVLAEHYAGDDTNVGPAPGRCPWRLRWDKRRGFSRPGQMPSCAPLSIPRLVAGIWSARTRR